MTESMFDDYPGTDEPEPSVDPYDGLGHDARLTAKRRDQIAQGIHPATGLMIIRDTDRTCADCKHLWFKQNRTFKGWKCQVAAKHGNHGPDMRKSWPACIRWEPKP
ncbi:hypothetical protein ACQBAU_16175 [Propionibacteriaceae bacterium Y2011]